MNCMCLQLKFNWWVSKSHNNIPIESSNYDKSHLDVNNLWQLVSHTFDSKEGASCNRIKAHIIKFEYQTLKLQLAHAPTHLIWWTVFLFIFSIGGISYYLERISEICINYCYFGCTKSYPLFQKFALNCLFFSIFGIKMKTTQSIYLLFIKFYSFLS